MKLLVLVTVLSQVLSQQFLTIQNGALNFTYNGKLVYLNGANQPWINYGMDFGNNQSNGIFCALNETLQNISISSGNIVREWLFVEGTTIPLFDNNGNVIGTDSTNSLINDLSLYLKAAADANVFVLLTLWNGAITIKDNLKGLMMDENKLQTFIDKALIPMVNGLKNEPALAGYEIINEPCGSIKAGDSTGNTCTDTTKLANSGAGWTNSEIPMENMQKFINLQVSAIKQTDPKTLVTVGIWNEMAATDNFGYTNYFSDKCLVNAGGKSDGILDYQQIHTYSWNGKYDEYSPVNIMAAQYGINKPIMVGEFENQLTGYPYTILYPLFNANGYQGGLAWAMNANNDANNNYITIDQGMNSLAATPNVKVNIINKPGLSGRCWCSDKAPDNQYTCQQQASWGKCNESWMAGYCCQSCYACQGCT